MTNGKDARVELSEREVGDLVRALSRPNLSRQLGAGARRLAEALEGLAEGRTVTVALGPGTAAVRQPYVVVEDQRVLPADYPDGFGHCPLGLVLATGAWTKGVYRAGYRTLGELAPVRLVDVPDRDAAFDLSLLSTRRRADALFAGTETPPGGYPALPDRLSTAIPLADLLGRILAYLPEANRRLIRLAFGLGCEARGLTAIARDLGISPKTAKSRLHGVLGTATFVFDWGRDLDALTRPERPEGEAWLRDLRPAALPHATVLREAHAWYRGKMFKDHSWVRRSFPPRPGFSPP